MQKETPWSLALVHLCCISKRLPKHRVLLQVKQDDSQQEGDGDARGEGPGEQDSGKLGLSLSV